MPGPARTFMTREILAVGDALVAVGVGVGGSVGDGVGVTVGVAVASSAASRSSNEFMRSDMEDTSSIIAST